MADRPFFPPKQRSARGFTLIEIMVALAVFSLAALALIRLEGQSIRSTTILTDTLIAQMVARNVAIEAATDAQVPAAGTTSGVEQNGGRRWTWTRSIRPTGNAAIVRIDVLVAGADGRQVGRLTMVRPPDPPVVVAS